MKRWYALFKGWLGALLVMLAMSLAAGTALAGGFGFQGHQSLGTVSVRELPPEAVQTIALIVRGGPFANRQDGRVFSNREKVLPRRPHGYYTEYTVRTPGAHNRGARRIVAGAGPERNPATGHEYWYTDDHYRTFRRVVK